MCDRNRHGAAMTSAATYAEVDGCRMAVFWDGQHWEIMPVKSNPWVARKGILAVRVAQAKAHRRYVDGGTDRLVELLAQAVSA